MEISEFQLRKLRNYLNNEIGFYIDDSKMQNIYKRKVVKLLKDKNYTDFEDFFKDLILKKSSILKQDLINVFMVNETYFFREKYQFDTLINYVLPELDLLRPKNEVINILCAPVSTGEEIYSIAIMLMEEGNLINKRDFMLLGIDIDSDAINKAKEGVYSERSVHKLPDEIKEKYFIKTGNKYRVKDFLKKAVNFKIVNIMDKYQMKKLGMFDVIFSRNMLIYFDDESRKQVAMTFYEMLKPKGVVFLGHAESMSRIVSVFRTARSGKAIYYIKD